MYAIATMVKWLGNPQKSFITIGPTTKRGGGGVKVGPLRITSRGTFFAASLRQLELNKILSKY